MTMKYSEVWVKFQRNVREQNVNVRKTGRKFLEK